MAAPTLDTIRAALRKGGLNAADLAAQVSHAEKLSAAAAERSRTAAAVLVDQPLASAADRAKHRDAAAAAHLEAEDASAVLAAAQRAHADAAAAEAEQVRSKTYNEAKAKAEAVRKGLATRYSAIVGDTLALLRDIAEANAATEAANAMLPAGVEPLNPPEFDARGTPYLPALPDEVETVKLWAFEDGAPVTPDNLHRVKDYGGGRGVYATVRVEGRDEVETGQPVVQRAFKRVVSYPAVGGSIPLPLASQIRLPAVFGDYLIWGAYGHFAPDGSLAEIIRAQSVHGDEVQPKAPTKKERPSNVELRPIWTPAEVERAHSPASDYHDHVSHPSGTGRASVVAPSRAAGGRR